MDEKELYDNLIFLSKGEKLVFEDINVKCFFISLTHNIIDFIKIDFDDNTGIFINHKSYVSNNEKLIKLNNYVKSYIRKNKINNLINENM